MARPVTLFTGQWADLPLAELAPQGDEAEKHAFDAARDGEMLENLRRELLKLLEEN